MPQSRIPVSKLVLTIKRAKNIKGCLMCNSGKIKRYRKQYIVQKGVKHSFSRIKYTQKKICM